MASKAKSSKTGGVKRQPKPTAADRGVPAVYLNAETGRFKPGFDARLKGDLTAAVLGLPEPRALTAWTSKAALAVLTERGWLRFLEERRAAVERKQAKAASLAAKKAALAAKPKATPKAKTEKAPVKATPNAAGQRRPSRSSRRSATSKAA